MLACSSFWVHGGILAAVPAGLSLGRFALLRSGLFSVAATNATTTVPTSIAYYGTAAAPLKYGKLSDDPIIRIQQKAAREPRTVAVVIEAARRAVEDPVVLAADTETSGIYPDRYGKHRIVSLGVTAYRLKRPEVSAEYIINPERPCHPEASAVHGLSDKDLAVRPTFPEIAPAFFNLLNQYPDALLWFHNAPFDKRMLNAELARCPAALKTVLQSHNPVYCSWQLAKLLRAKDNKLDNLCDRYGIDRSSRANGHGAEIDTHLLMQMLFNLSEDVLDTANQAGILDDMLDLAVKELEPAKPAFSL